MAVKKVDREKLVRMVCLLTERSDKSLDAICKHPSLPCSTEFREWIREDAALASLYSHAKAVQMDFIAHQTLELAEGPDSSKARNQIDARKWLASKLAPKKYGDKLQIDGHITVETDVTSLQSALAIHHILKSLSERAKLHGEVVELPQITQQPVDNSKSAC